MKYKENMFLIFNQVELVTEHLLSTMVASLLPQVWLRPSRFSECSRAQP